MTKSRDAREDFVGGLRPDERRRAFVRDVDVPDDGGFQVTGAAMDAAPQLFVSERREPTLYQVDPRGAGRGEMHVVSRVANEPAVDDRRLMGPVVVANHMNVERRRHGGLDGVEELAELPRAVPMVKLANDLPGLDVQRGEK